ATFFYITGATAISLSWIAVALVLGAAMGYILAVRVPMTGMPQMVALLNGFGGLASLLVACADYSRVERVDAVYTQWLGPHSPWYGLLATGLTILVGGVTFTGSLVAYGKLQGVRWVPDKPVQFSGQKAAII